MSHNLCCANHAEAFIRHPPVLIRLWFDNNSRSKNTTTSLGLVKPFPRSDPRRISRRTRMMRSRGTETVVWGLNACITHRNAGEY